MLTGKWMIHKFFVTGGSEDTWLTDIPWTRDWEKLQKKAGHQILSLRFSDMSLSWGHGRDMAGPFPTKLWGHLRQKRLVVLLSHWTLPRCSRLIDNLHVQTSIWGYHVSSLLHKRWSVLVLEKYIDEYFSNKQIGYCETLEQLVNGIKFLIIVRMKKTRQQSHILL